jgi:hypothetical protein
MPEAGRDRSSGTLAQQMNPLHHFAILTVMALSSALGWRYPTEFFPDQEKTYDWDVLRHPDTEFYIVRLPTMQEVQKYRRNKKDFFGKVTPIMLGPYMSYEPHFPTTKFTLFKRDSEGDHYEITLDEQAFPRSEKKTVVYSGSRVSG